MLYATTVTTEQELQQIIDLQRINLKQHISEEEKQRQGFLTMTFTMDMLRAMHQLAPSIVVKNDNDQLLAYAIVFVQEARAAYPNMDPLLRHLTHVEWRGKPFSECKFYIMGQICVAKEVRGMGVFDVLYHKHRDIYREKFDCIVTEISLSNSRSLRAHKRVGFETISTHADTIDDWEVVAWDWK